MIELDDHELLAEFARSASEAAFALLVMRHVNLVYSAALRFTGNPHHAEEITQAVFIIFSKKAKDISRKNVVSGWLYQTARLTAANFLKGEIRRQQREQESYMQSTLTETDSEVWKQLAPLLDEAMGRLGETDRAALVLRFFENKSAGEIAAALRINEDAAQRRVTRALEKLRKLFTKRGVIHSSEAITGAISAHSVQPAPALLAKSVAAAAIAKGAAASTSTLTLIKGTLKVMAWTKVRTAVVTSAIVLLATGTTIITVQKVQQHQDMNASAQNKEPILITPNVSVGKVKVGMSEDEVVAALGKPEKMQGKIMIYDQRFGFSVFFTRKKIITDVFCGDSMLDYPGVKKFKGRTKEGIGMESTREEVIKAFGQPTSAKPGDVARQQEQLEYKPLGLTFLLEKGKVFHIAVNLRKPL